MRRRPLRSAPIRPAFPAVDRFEPRLLWAAHVAGSPASYATIQSAVDAAAAGGTVTVDAGTYAEQVTVTKPLTIRGAQAGVDARANGRSAASASTESVVTGASGSSGTSSAFHVLANDVTVDGFTVTGQTNPDEALGAGIVIGPNRAGTHLVNDVVRGNVTGIFLSNNSATDAALIQDCYVSGNNNAGANGGRGIYTDNNIFGSKLTNVTIDDNTFVNDHGGSGTTGYEAAMAFEAWTAGCQTNIRITNNTVTNCGKATLFFNTVGVLIQGNTVTGTGDQWSGTLRFEGDNSNVQILYNTLHNNRGPAVAVDSKGMPGDNSGFVVNYNNFWSNNTSYPVPISVANNFDTYDGTFDARYNYWGSTDGPSGWGPGTGDAVGGGYMQIGSGGRGWQLTTGGSMPFTPFATALITATTAAVPSAPAAVVATATGTRPSPWRGSTRRARKRGSSSSGRPTAARPSPRSPPRPPTSSPTPTRG